MPTRNAKICAVIAAARELHRWGRSRELAPPVYQARRDAFEQLSTALAELDEPDELTVGSADDPDYRHVIDGHPIKNWCAAKRTFGERPGCCYVHDLERHVAAEELING